LTFFDARVADEIGLSELMKRQISSYFKTCLNLEGPAVVPTKLIYLIVHIRGDFKSGPQE
jgi:hypothetical protein